LALLRDLGGSLFARARKAFNHSATLRNSQRPQRDFISNLEWTQK
jgi:hypothetical protein